MALGTTNISTTLVAQTLGVGSNDVGTLCQHANINKWSKWKPVCINKTNGITVADLASVNYGISFPIFRSLENLFLAYHDGVGGGADWFYAKPTGSSNAPFRLGDFRNYKHDAVNVVANPKVKSVVFLNGTTTDRAVTGTFISAFPDDTQIGFSDLISAYSYFGIAIFNSSNVLVKYAINPTAGSTSVSLDSYIEGLAIDTYKGILFLSSSPTAVNDIIGIDKWLVEYKTIQIKDKPITVSMSSLMTGIGQFRPVSVKMTFKNYKDSDIDLLSCKLKLRLSTKSFDDTMEIDEQSQVVGDITVISGTTQITYTFNDVDSTKRWRIWWDNVGTYSFRLSGVYMTEQQLE